MALLNLILKGQSQGHADFKVFDLIKEPSEGISYY